MPGVNGRPRRPKTCTWCEARFLPRSGNQKRCPTCREWHAIARLYPKGFLTDPPTEAEKGGSA